METVKCFARPVVTAVRDETIGAVARLMDNHNVGAVVITECGRPTGIVTDRDIAVYVAAYDGPATGVVERIMQAPVVTIGQDDSIIHAAQLMMDRRIRQLPTINEHGQIVGIVTVDDLLRLLVCESANLIEAMRPETQVKGIAVPP